jgi:hypothetical protein
MSTQLTDTARRERNDMSTATADERIAAPDAFTRIRNVARLHFANPWNMVVVPWMIIGFVFVVNLAIWIIIHAASDGSTSLAGTKWAGSTFYIFVYFIVVAVQAMNRTFAFALGYSATRRDYYLGTALAFTVQSASFHDRVRAAVVHRGVDERLGSRRAHVRERLFLATGPSGSDCSPSSPPSCSASSWVRSAVRCSCAGS